MRFSCGAGSVCSSAGARRPPCTPGARAPRAIRGDGVSSDENLMSLFRRDSWPSLYGFKHNRLEVQSTSHIGHMTGVLVPREAHTGDPPPESTTGQYTSASTSKPKVLMRPGQAPHKYSSPLPQATRTCPRLCFLTIQTISLLITQVSRRDIHACTTKIPFSFLRSLTFGNTESLLNNTIATAATHSLTTA